MTRRSSRIPKQDSRSGDNAPLDVKALATWEKQQQIDQFLDLNLGTQDERDYRREVSKWVLYSKLFLTITVQTCLCFLFFVFFVFVRPAKNRNPRNDSYTDEGEFVRGHRKPAGWPTIGGVSIALTVIGTATTFLLVFSLGWTFQRWRSARALVGNTMSTLREYYIYMGANLSKEDDLSEDEKTALQDLKTSLIWFGAMLIIYMDAKPLVDENEETSGCYSVWQCCLWLYDTIATFLATRILGCTGKPPVSKYEIFRNNKTKTFALDAATPKRKASDVLDRRFNTDQMKKEVIKAHVKIRKQYLKIQQIGTKTVDGKTTRTIATDQTAIPCGMHTRLLQNFYAMDKFKKVEMPRLIKQLLWVLTYCYTCVIFPVLMPYTFVMNLDPYASQKKLLLHDGWSTAYFVGVFVFSTTLVLTYFNALFSIQQELEDPFGDDFSDIKLRYGFLTPFLEDMKVIHKSLQKGESNAAEPRLLHIFDSEKPLLRVNSASGDGEEELPVKEVLMPDAIPE